MNLVKSYFRYFTHHSIASDSIDYTKNLMRLSSVTLTCSASLFYMLAAYILDYTIGIYVCLFLVMYHVFLLYSIKYKRFSDEALAHFSGIFSSIAIGAAVYTTGGPHSPVIFWLLASIVYAFWLASMKTGIFWTLLLFAQYLVMFIFKETGHQFPNYVPQEYHHIFYFLIFTGVFTYLSVMLIFFDIWRRAVISKLNMLNFTKDRMISMIGHDLKNPLSILMGQASVLDETKVFDENYHESSKYLLNRMKRIIENMVVFERIESDNLESSYDKIDLNQMITELLVEYEYHSKSHEITINYIKKADIAFKQIDRVNVERILSNLISNSLKYSPKKTTITILTEINDDKAIISIKDQGIGIEKDQLISLFDIYTKGPVAPLLKKADSNGIGLYIVNQLCKKVGASIEVFSEGRNRGSEFKITLPLS